NADLGLVLGNRDLFNGLDRPHVEMQARHGQLWLGRAEAQLDADFLRIDGIDRIEPPERHDGEDAADQRPAPAGQPAAELVAAAIENIFEVGRIAAAWPTWTTTATRCLRPGPASVAATPTSVILPRHCVPFG